MPTTYRSRSEIIQHTETVRLKAQFTGPDGTPVDLDTFPKVAIIQPDGSVVLSPTSSGVSRLTIGLYEYDWSIGINDQIGVWSDVWSGILNGFTLQNTFQFVIEDTNLPNINSDGYLALGDDVGFNYSQIAIFNINKCLKALRARLNSSGKVKSKDKYGNVIYISCDIYSTDVLVTMLGDSLSIFNAIPHFTMFEFDDSQFIKQFLGIIVQGATIRALASQQLIEKGREFNISDNGISFTPPGVSEPLGSQYSAELTNWTDQVKLIKASMKPAPVSLGTLSVTTIRNPVLSNLRMRRARQII